MATTEPSTVAEDFTLLGQMIGHPLVVRLIDGSTGAQMVGRLRSVESDSGILGAVAITVERDRDLDRRTRSF